MHLSLAILFDATVTKAMNTSHVYIHNVCQMYIISLERWKWCAAVLIRTSCACVPVEEHKISYRERQEIETGA